MLLVVTITSTFSRGLELGMIGGRACGLAIVWMIPFMTSTGLSQHIIPIADALATKI